MLAELELNSEISICIDQILFTRNDINNYFDQLQQDDMILWHNAVEEDKVLLTFLENMSMRKNERFSQNTLYSTFEFIRWISPCFLFAFCEFIDSCFTNNNEGGLQAILSNPLLMTEHDQEEAWQSVRHTLANPISFLNYERDRIERNVAPRSVIDELSGIMGFSYISMIALLPESKFGSLKDEYAILMMETAIQVLSKFPKDGYLAVIWIDNARHLASSPEVKIKYL